MYDKFLSDRDRAVEVGDRVAVMGYRGTVTSVFHGVDKQWDGCEYVSVPGSEYTHVKVHFDENQDIAEYGQYQDGTYGGFTVIESEVK